MKKLRLLTILLLLLLLPQTAYANMAAPETADLGAPITFEKNEEIAVLSEVLHIVVEGSEADITATYHMRNTTDQAVSTPVMFLSPNVEQSGTKVLADGAELAFETDSYGLYWGTEVEAEGWQYAVLNHGVSAEEAQVDSVSFTLDFGPGEEYDVVVSYRYKLGGYPHLDFDAKRGEIRYYLTPAALWKDFENLTIHLQLDEDMPVLVESSLEFEKVGEGTYLYVSDTLPEVDLDVVIDETWLQNIFSTLRSPYLKYTMTAVVLVVLPLTAVAVVFLWSLRKQWKKMRK